MPETTSLQPGDLMTFAEAAQLIRTRPRTLQWWCQQGLLTKVRLGKRSLLRKRDLELLVETSTVHATRSPHAEKTIISDQTA